MEKYISPQHDQYVYYKNIIVVAVFLGDRFVLWVSEPDHKKL